LESEKKASEILQEMVAGSSAKSIGFAKILENFKERGIAFFMLLFAAPAALPTPAQVIATVLGAIVIVLSVQLMMGRKTPYILKRILDKNISIKIIKGVVKLLRKAEYFVRPRLLFLSTDFSERIVAVFCLAFAIMMAIPLPLSNTVPGFAIVLMSLGLFNRDGLFIIAGAIIGTAWIGLYTLAIYIAGDNFVQWIKDLIF